MRRSKVLVLDTELLMVEHSMCCGAIADSLPIRGQARCIWHASCRLMQAQTRLWHTTCQPAARHVALAGSPWRP